MTAKLDREEIKTGVDQVPGVFLVAAKIRAEFGGEKDRPPIALGRADQQTG